MIENLGNSNKIHEDIQKSAIGHYDYTNLYRSTVSYLKNNSTLEEVERIGVETVRVGFTSNMPSESGLSPVFPGLGESENVRRSVGFFGKTGDGTLAFINVSTTDPYLTADDMDKLSTSLTAVPAGSDEFNRMTSGYIVTASLRDNLNTIYLPSSAEDQFRPAVDSSLPQQLQSITTGETSNT